MNINSSNFTYKEFIQNQGIMDIIPLPILITKYDGSIIYYNKNFEKTYSNESQEISGSVIIDFPISVSKKSQFFDELKKTDKIDGLEIEIVTESGKNIIAKVATQTLIDLEEPILCFTFFDCTTQTQNNFERERLLEEIAISRAQIEEEAAKYIQLNIQLEESEVKLKELNDTKDKFFSIIGHDLKNPIFVIQSMSEILETEFDEISQEERIDFIKAIRESSFTAYSLLEDLLNWARCQSGRIDYNPQPIHLKQLGEKCFQLAEANAVKKNIKLKNSVNATHMAFADKFMIELVIRNLVSNAIKFTNEGGTVRLSTFEVDNKYVVEVEDTGIGLSEVDINKLFRIEVKNSEIGRSKEKGTGLGLILCKEFVEKHEGKIWVESELEKGSKFIFTIPKL